MSSNDGAIILTFHSVHAAIRAERILKASGRSPELIPVPREIASDCGFCILLDGAEGTISATELECEAVWKVSVVRESDGHGLAGGNAGEGKGRKSYERIETRD